MKKKKSPTHLTITKMLTIDKEKYSRTFAPNLTFFLFFGSKITSFNYNRYDPPCCKLLLFSSAIQVRYRPRFFDQVGHQITYASMGNKHFITK